LIDAGPRSAAALAAEATEVAVIDRTAFHAILREEPEFALAIMRLLAARIRRLDAALRRP
jgi:CRP/FNR family transcriptional regulator, cyclic AMP receptor protein